MLTIKYILQLFYGLALIVIINILPTFVQNKSALEDLQHDKLEFSPQQSGELKQVPKMIINSKSAGAVFEQRDLFQSEMKSAADFARVSEVVSEGIIVKPDLATMQRVLTEKNQFLILPVPDGKGGIIELEVSKVNNFAPDFLINTSSPTDEALDEAVGVHYRGVIKGNKHSLVAISIFKTEVMGFFSTDSDGNSVIGRLSGNNPDNSHIIYSDRNLKTYPKVSGNMRDTTDTNGDTTDSNVGIPEWMLENPQEVLARCIRIYIEADYNLFLNKGSVANTTSYLTGLFNQSAAIFSNEGISIIISEIFVWNSQSPYTGTNSFQFLQQFKNTRTNYNGDVAHLVSIQTYGGRADGVGKLCNKSSAYDFSSIFANYNTVPTYSWSVQVFTHELGHTFGSEHTHACVWNSNNTAIDSCGPAVGLPYEGQCTGAPLPTQTGGTIMSYCNLQQNVGINFNLGFGTQPRNVMVNKINTSTCLTGCGGGTTAQTTRFDFDGDSKADVSVFRPENGAWYLNQSANGFTGVSFGQNGDRIVPADYDGDGKTDLAVYRAGTWYLNRSQLGFTGISFGETTDVPAAADYDGDGKADIAVFRPSTGVWYLLRSQLGFTGIQFGQTGDKPVAADYDGDSKADVAVYRSGVWYLNRSQLGFTGISFGELTDVPTPADYDADGKTDVAVFRPSTGTWYLNRSQLGFTGVSFGQNGDLPVAADYDGDGRADVSVFRNGTWYLNRSQAGFTGISFGAAADKPVPNAFIP